MLEDIPKGQTSPNRVWEKKKHAKTRGGLEGPLLQGEVATMSRAVQRRQRSKHSKGGEPYEGRISQVNEIRWKITSGSKSVEENRMRGAIGYGRLI